jgi:hypothetical protein
MRIIGDMAKIESNVSKIEPYDKNKLYKDVKYELMYRKYNNLYKITFASLEQLQQYVAGDEVKDVQFILEEMNED